MTQRRVFTKSWSLLREAERSIPGGIHLSGRPLTLPGMSPVYIESAEGGRCRDVDGNEYIDLIMALGPVLLGYAHANVDEAAMAQARQGNLLTLSHPLQLRFIERLLRWFPAAEMGHFFKTGSEATTAALRIARRHTARRKVARCGYHGWHDWCLPHADFVPGGLDEQVLGFDASRPDTLATALEGASGEVAAVILAAEAMVPADAELYRELIRVTHRHGAVFVLDEIKTAFRAPSGSLQQMLKIAPDLTTVSKALGNGWPIAALVGRREVMQCAAGMHLSATYHGELSAIAAALATLDVLEREPIIDTVCRRGERLIAGLNASAQRYGLPFEARAEPVSSMPNLRVSSAEPGAAAKLSETFYSEVIDGGVLLHPRHVWFVSHAHTEADIDQVIAVADQAMATTRAMHAELLQHIAPDGAIGAANAPAKASASRHVARQAAFPGRRRTRAAIVGCGARARMHALAYTSMEELDIVAICDVDEGRRRAFAREFAILAQYADVAQMLERETPELVIVATGPTQRVPLMQLLMEREVPLVLVEKPLALDAEDLSAIRAIAQGAQHTRFVVNLQLRFHERLARLMASVRDGAIGEPRLIDASCRMNAADQGAHLIDLAFGFGHGATALSVFGQASAIDMSSAHAAPALLFGELTLSNRVRIALTCGPSAPKVSDDPRIHRHKRIAVYGTRGFVHWNMQGWECSDANGYSAGSVNYLEEDLRAQVALVRAALTDEPGEHPTSLRDVEPQANALIGLYASSLSQAPVQLPYLGVQDVMPLILANSVFSGLVAPSAAALGA